MNTAYSLRSLSHLLAVFAVAWTARSENAPSPGAPNSSGEYPPPSATADPIFGAGLALPGITLMPVIALPGWTFKGSSGGLNADADGWRAFRIRTSNSDKAPVLEGGARFTKAGGTGAVRAEWRVAPSADIELLETAVAGNIPASAIGGGRAVLDGQEVAIPLDGHTPHIFRGEVSRLSLVDRTGAEILRADFNRRTRILLQDGAYWGGAHLTLRVYFAEGPLKGGTEYTVGAVFATPVAGALALGTGSGVTITAGPDWIPLHFLPWIEPGSALDFSAVVPHHAPAGMFGRVVVVGDHFEFENLPGEPQRFYGVNLCGTANLPSSREAADRFAANIARIGYNALRIHHHERYLIAESGNWREGQDDTEPDPAQWEKFDNLVAAAVEHGLYLTTDLFVSRSHVTPWRSLGIDRDGCLSNTGHFKVLCAFWEPAYSNLCAWTRNFLGHVNPRTGRSLAKEPALATLALVNEGNLGNWGGTFLRDLPGVQEAWRAWLAKRKASGDAAYADIPDTIPSELYSGGGNSPADRHVAAFAIFLAERETALFERLKAFVREECGCLAPLSSLSCWYNPDQYQLPRTHFDYVDDHFYVDHPNFLDRAWNLPSWCPNVNPVAGAGGGARDVEWRRLMDKPFCLTEWNYSAPGRFRGVGGIATGALGALQDWDGMWRFAWSHSRGGIESPGGRIGYFDMNSDPLGLAAERAALCLFLRRDIEPLPEARPAILNEAALRDPRHGALHFPGPNQPLSRGWEARVGSKVVGGTVPAGQDSGGTVPAGQDSGGTVPAGQDSVVIDRERGLFLIDTPRTAGGFSEAGTLEAGVLRFTLRDAPATVWASSLDSRPLAESSQILVTHLTDVQNSAMRYGDPGLTILLDWGCMPHLMRRGEADITFSFGGGAGTEPGAQGGSEEAGARAPLVLRLDCAGKRLGEVPSAWDAATGRLTFTARTDIDPDDATCLYEIIR